MVIGFHEVPPSTISPFRTNSDLVENIFCREQGHNGQNSNPTYPQYSSKVNLPQLQMLAMKEERNQLLLSLSQKYHLTCILNCVILIVTERELLSNTIATIFQNTELANSFIRVSKVTVRFSRKQKRDELNESLEKHRHALRAEPMTFLTRELACAVNGWWMVSTVCNGHRNWIELMKYLYPAF